ncbi:MAG: RidA family protein [Firmicutes bacterium]|nr:RidA family protein [Bacillota bacterium]
MKVIETKKAPAAIGPYSQAIIFENLVFTSGQIPLSPDDGSVVGENIREQTEAAIKNLEAVLHAAGSSLQHVIKTTCFLSDINYFAEFNEVYARYFPNKPARSCVEVSALPKNVLIEIEAVAEIM